MSLNRLIFYGAIIGGWSAFVGWFLCEMLFIRLFGIDPNTLGIVVLMAAFVGAGIGGGLMMLGGVASGKWSGVWKRLGFGALGGLAAGVVGGLIAGGLYAALGGIFARIIGWVLVGLAIGAVDGIYELSLRRLRNGLIGGGVGGFFGGLLLTPIASILASSTGMAGRCFGFVILGMCVGLLISLVQVVLKTAWLTVVDGFRPGRQLILNEAQTTIGTSEKVALPFIAFGAKGVEPVHLVIYRQPDGTYAVMDNNSRTGTRLNGQPLTAPALLRDGDVLNFGVNMVRFSEKRRALGEAAVAGSPGQPVRTVAAPAHAVRAGAPPVAVSPVNVAPGQPYQQPPSRPYIPVQGMPQAPPPPPRPAPPQPYPQQPQPYPQAPQHYQQPPQQPRPASPPQPYPAAPQQYQPPPQQPPRPPAPQQPYPQAPQQYQPPAPPQQPPRQAPPQNVPQQPQRPAAPPPPAGAAPAAQVGSCPNCGFRTTGVPGKRFCIVCQQNF